MCNVSAHGFMGRCPVPPQPGTQIELECPTLRLHGRVIWSGERRFGVFSTASGGDAPWLRAPPALPAPVFAPEAGQNPRPRLAFALLIVLAGLGLTAFTATLIPPPKSPVSALLRINPDAALTMPNNPSLPNPR